MTDEPTLLIVDDNEDLLETFAMIFKRRGFRVETASNGISAVAKFQDRGFDITIMDVVMPEMNGVEALRKIKEIRPEAPVILITAYSDESLIQAAREEGARRVISKPIQIDRLMELIKELADSETILVIDDDPDICQTLTRVLEQQGYKVLAAYSGSDAVAIMQDRGCQIAFIDVRLPDIDGLETFLRLKQINPEIVTVMMTGFRSEVKDALEKAREASAIACLYKPFDPTEAADLVKKIGRKTRYHRRDEDGR